MPDVFITRKIKIPSLTLNQNDLNGFKTILEKTGNSPTFNIETATEEMDFSDFQNFSNRKWPATIKQLSFKTSYSGRSIRGTIYTHNIYGMSAITIQDNDRDWISARVDELVDFFDQHRNWHGIFHNIKYMIAQGLVLVILFNYFVVKLFPQFDWKSLFTPVVLMSCYLTWYLYGSVLPRVFPYLVLEPEHSSLAIKIRTTLKYVIPAVFVGLFINLLWQLIS